MTAQTLLAMLEGSAHASAAMPWGKPGPIALPRDPGERAALVDSHLAGEAATVTYCKVGEAPRLMRVDPLAIFALCPGADELVRFVAIDFDAGDHGRTGLIDPPHAVRCLAERVDAAGLFDGLLVARSRGGRGRHVFVFPPAPISLDDAVLAVAAIAANAFRIATADVADTGELHAFRNGRDRVAEIGESGAFELLPYSKTKPERGWSIALPSGGAVAHRGGGIIVDPFTDSPIELRAIPRADARHWAHFIDEARAELLRRPPAKREPLPATRRSAARRDNDPLDSADARTREFVAGRAPEGSRNRAAFTGACELLARGVDPREVEGLILAGAAACGLPAHEARAAVASAVGAMRRRGKLR